MQLEKESTGPDGLIRVDQLTAGVAARWGLMIGISANGYPTSWCSTRQELDRIRRLLEQENKQ